MDSIRPRFARLPPIFNRRRPLGSADPMPESRMHDRTAKALLERLDNIWKEVENSHLLQEQSPLFSVLPAEIRNEIFALALAEYDDLSKPYARDTYYWRPHHRGPRRTDVDLLRTCKRIWLETRPLPLKAIRGPPMAFFVACSDRRPPEYQSQGPFQTLRARRLLNKQWDALDTIQIFLQGLTRDNIEAFFGRSVLKPSTVIFTTRYTDWLWWENKHPLSLDGSQMRSIELPPSITKVIMEFEMIKSREKELRDFLNDIFQNETQYRWYCRGDRTLTIAYPEDAWSHVQEWTWEGPTKFGAESFDHHPTGDTMIYSMKAVTWEEA